MRFPRPKSALAAVCVAAVATSALLLTPVAIAAKADDGMITGPLQNRSKTTFVGLSGNSWRDTIATPSDVEYPAPGESGVVTVDGTCVSRTTSPSDAALAAIPTGDGSGCLVFSAKITSEGFFTFVVDTPGAPANGRYLGDGSAGGVLDLIASTPLVLFAIPERPDGTADLSGTITDTDDDGRIGAGDELVWTVTLENSGNVRLRDLQSTLADGSPVSCSAPDIDAGKTLECTARRALTQAEVDAGSVSTTLTATAKTPRGTAFDLGTAEAEVSVTGARGVGASVTSDLGAAPASGDTVTYTVPITNTGTVTLTALSVTPSVGRVDGCDDVVLAPGQSVSCRVVRTLTQAEVDSGKAAFSADITGATANGPDAKTRVALEQDIATSATASVATTSDAGASVQVGQTIRYTTTVTNTGTVTLSGLAAQPAIGTAAACEQTSLAPGASTTCAVTYTATRADVDAGAVEQSVAVVGAAPGADAARLGSADVRDVAVAAPDVDASVVTDAADVPAVGDVVTATVTVTNTGNVTLSDVTVDPATGDPVTCVDATLAPGATTTCTVVRAPLTQADIDRGAVDFSGDVLATTPAGVRSVLGGVRVTDPVPATPSATASMTSDAGPTPKVGQTVRWTTSVTNTGNVTLSEVVVDTADGTGVCDVDGLAPGQRATCTTSAEVTQADVDRGTLDRQAIVSAAAPGAAPAEVTRATSSDRIAPVPALSTSTTSDVTERTGAGDQVTWTTTVTNTGNVTLSALEIGAGTCDTAVLAPGAETRCVVSRVLTQADVDAGVVRVDEAVSATTPAGVASGLARATAEAPIAQHPGLTATSTSDADEQPAVGDVVTVVVAIENSGDVTIRDLALRPDRGDVTDCAPAPLVPGARTECVVTTTLTQADVDAGGLDLGTSVLGSTPTEEGVDLAETSVRVDVPAEPAATLALAAAVRERLDPGVELRVEATVTNTGNVTLSDVELGAAADQQVTCPDGAIAPGESATCTITVTVTQAHVDAGGIEFHADGTAAVPSGARTTIPTADLTVPIDAEPGATLTLEVEPGADLSVGGTVGFRATVANTGNVTLSDLTVSRFVAFAAKRGDAEGPAAPECADETVPVGGSVVCSFERTLTQADLDSGSVRETVTASAEVPSGDDLAVAPASVTIAVPRAVQGSTALSASTDGPVSEGDRVTLTTTVRNTGSVTLRDLVARESDDGDQECRATDLAPGEETSCASERTVTAADVERGAFEAVVTVTATDPQGHGVDLPDASVKIAATAPAELAFTGVQGIALTTAVALALLSLGVFAMVLTGRRRRAETGSH
ncbi:MULTISPECIES: hypothetical protein [unclassified Curtobacterium]|uniref:DUF7507 domain-containing protein n=1 Tax=unclassified Curtobacterium TaxID=257496 RepID=UPI003814E023